LANAHGRAFAKGSLTESNKRFERSRAASSWGKEEVDDLDKAAPFDVGEAPRRSTSSLDGMIDDTAKFEIEGFAVIPNVASPAQCEAVVAKAALAASDAPGSRTLLSMPWCAALAHAIRNNKAVRSLLPDKPVAVQCTYFEKSESQNWLVAVHQDLSIPVRKRIDAAAWLAWSKAKVSAPRRVLHFVFGAPALPLGLTWHTAV